MMANSLPWLRWYPRDFLQDWRVRMLSWEERAVYREALDVAFTEGGLPTEDPAVLAVLFSIPEPVVAAAWPKVRVFFGADEDGRLRSPRQELEVAKAKNRKPLPLGGLPQGDPGGGVPVGYQGGTPGAPVGHPVGTQGGTPLTDQTRPDTDQSKAVVAADKPRPARKKPSGDHARVIDEFRADYVETRGIEYVVQGAKDGQAVSWMLKTAKASPEEVRERSRRMLGHREQWVAENASLALLRSQWNKFGVEVQPLNGARSTQQQQNLANLTQWLHDKGEA